jgi:eukaryotic-like serine/threonine-protein kinase
VSDFIDGVRWSELGRRKPPPPLDVSLRVLVDILGGLWAIHNLRDTERRPLKLVHGELTPQNVVVGFDGISKVIGQHRVRTPAGPDTAATAYLAPEALIADAGADARADVFSVGAMLWEALSGKALFAGMSASAISTQVSTGRVPRATLPENCAWAAPLIDIAARALSADPANRFASTAAFATELRRVGGPKLAQRTRVEALVRSTYGEEIRTRRQALERGEGARDVSAVEAVEPHAGRYPSVPIEFELDDGDGGTAPTPFPPALAQSRAAPPTLAPPQLPAPPTLAPPPRFPTPPPPAGPPRFAAPPPFAAPPRLAAPPPLPPPRTQAATAGFPWPAPPHAPQPPAAPRIALAPPASPRGLTLAVEDAATDPIGLVPALDPAVESALESVPPSAPPLASTSPDARPRSRRPRAALVVAMGLSILAAPMLLWWIGSSPHHVARDEPSSPAAPSGPAAPSSNAPAAQSASPTVPPAEALAASAATPPDEPSPAADLDAATAATAATATTPATAAPSASVSAAGSAQETPAGMGAPIPHPVAKKKYEPEGI